jgi:hypothetical protein
MSIPRPARKLAKRLLRLHDKTDSWRKVAANEYDDKISFATLDRIATSDGQWTPKRAALRTLLDLPPLTTVRKPRRPRRVLPGSPCAGCPMLREFRAKCKIISFPK